MTSNVTLTILASTVRAIADETGETDGQALAKILRMAADRAEADIRVLPISAPGAIPEAHRFAERIDGVLVGAVVEIGPAS